LLRDFFHLLRQNVDVDAKTVCIMFDGADSDGSRFRMRARRIPPLKPERIDRCGRCYKAPGWIDKHQIDHPFAVTAWYGSAPNVLDQACRQS
jgi:hypothetical protein